MEGFFISFIARWKVFYWQGEGFLPCFFIDRWKFFLPCVTGGRFFSCLLLTGGRFFHIFYCQVESFLLAGGRFFFAMFVIDRWKVFFHTFYCQV